MPRILSRSHMPAAAGRRRSSIASSASVRRNSLVDYSTGPRSPNRQPQRRRHSTETCGVPAESVAVQVLTARHQPQHQQYESSTSFATALTTSSQPQRTSQSVATDFPHVNIAPAESSSKPSSWQGVSPPTSGTGSAAWAFGLGTSAPSVGTTATEFSAVSSLSSTSTARGETTASPRRKPRRSRRHSVDGSGGVLPAVPAPLKRNVSNDYGHFLEVAEDI